MPCTDVDINYSTGQRVLACVSDDWSSIKQIHERVGLWAPGTVKRYLLELRKAGVIEGEWRKERNGFGRMYFRRWQPCIG